MTDWSKPSVGSTYTNYTAELTARDTSIALMFDSSLVSDTNIITGTKRWNVNNKNWEQYSSGTWSALAAVYGISISGSAGSVPWSGVSSRPTSLAGYGIGDAYTVTTIDQLMVLKAPLASPVFTGNPTAVTQDSSDNSTRLATTEFVKSQTDILTDAIRVGPTTIQNHTSARYFYNSLLLSDGKIKQCGNAAGGQLADGGANVASNPTMSDALFMSDIKGETISKHVTGLYNSFVLTSSGKVYSCGNGSAGTSGHGTTVQVVGYTLINYFVANNITIVDIKVSGTIWWGAGYTKALFLTSTGDVYCTGYISKGDGSAIANTSTPTKVVGLSNIIGIYTGGDSLLSPCFAWSSTQLYSWGANYGGSSGQNTATVSNVLPVTSVFTGSIKKIVCESGPTTSAVSAYSSTSYILLNNGDVWACGYNAYGQIGDNTTTQTNIFKKVAALSNIVDIVTSGGIYGSILALNNTGNVYAWGYGAQYINSGVAGNLLVPTQISGNYKFITGSHGCTGTVWAYFLIDSTNEVKFTGYNSSYACGNPSVAAQTFTGLVTSRLPILDTDEYVTEVDIPMQYHTTGFYMSPLILTNKRRVFIVGSNTNGELGNGTTNTRRCWTELKF
jgi:alpha-tubulin suppressor-like RCC1 family protein